MAQELDPIKQVINIDVRENGADSAEKDIAKLNTTISSTTTENKKTEESFKSLKVQLREAIQLQQKLSQQYGSTSQEAVKATKAVAAIKDEIGFQKDLVDSYNPDDKFRKLSQTAGIAALALGGVKEGLNAVGIESEFLDKTIGTAQALLGVTSALSGMSDAYAILNTSKKVKSAADVVEIGTTGALAAANTTATATTWSWNAALLANPIVLIAAGIVAAGAAIYAFTKITSDAAKEEELARVATMQLDQAIEKQSKAFEDNSKSNSKNNDFKIALLRASGASEAQIYKETKALKEQELQLSLNASAEAYRQVVRAEDLDYENPTEFTKKTLENAKENYKKIQSEVEKNYDTLDDLRNENEVAKVQAETDARNKRIEAQKAAEEKERERLLKLKEDEKKKAQEDADDFNKFQNDQFNAQLAEKLRQREVEIEELALFNEAIEAEEQKKFEREKLISDSKLELERTAEEQRGNILEKGIQLVASVFSKSKAIQKGAIIAENAIGIGKQVIANNTANAGALATPAAIATSGAAAAPVIALNNISTGIGIAATIAATAKALSAVGGGGAGSGSGAPGGTATPTRNVAQVAFQGSSENQIGNAINRQNEKQPPVEVFVLSQSVRDAEELDRKKELLNSF